MKSQLDYHACMNEPFIQQLITKHEGRRAAVYLDSKGIPTIGIGFNLRDADAQDICDHFGISLPGLLDGTATLTDAQIDEIFDYQFHEAVSEAMTLFPTFMTMPDNVQAVIVDQVFNMGLPTFSQFHREIGAINAGNYKQAAIYAGQSLWAQQVPNRAADDIALLNAA